jgi:hypothetical protein
LKIFAPTDDPGASNLIQPPPLSHIDMTLTQTRTT